MHYVDKIDFLMPNRIKASNVIDYAIFSSLMLDSMMPRICEQSWLAGIFAKGGIGHD